MDQLTDYSDSRNKGFCIHCGSELRPDESNRDHVPTRGLLNRPYPENLPVVEVCRLCNSGFSSDEEYLIAFLGSVLSGSTRPDPVKFPVASGILTHSPRLGNRIDRCRTVQGNLWGGVAVLWEPELDRIERIVVKNARGHAHYEIGEPMLEQPSHVSVCPIEALTARQIEQFENIPHSTGWPEVGSRMMQRTLIIQSPGDAHEIHSDGWQDVQDGVYRYAVTQGLGGILVRMILREYLAAEVLWGDPLSHGDSEVEGLLEAPSSPLHGREVDYRRRGYRG